MALTRAQYLQGDSGQGNVLLGQVQGVKQGQGTLIAADGTISVDASTVVGLVKLNNPSAFNSYVWPSTSGSSTQFLMSDGAGNLSWQPPSIGSSVVVNDTAPTTSVIGQLWFDCSERILKIYENCDGVGSPSWTPVSRGKDAEPVNTVSVPSFQSGDGSQDEAYVLGAVTTTSGSFVRFPEVITISGFAPYQYVPITDLNSSLNGNRFSSSSYFSDGSGTLTFRVLYTDYPVSNSGVGYTANLEIGFGSVFIEAPINVAQPLSLTSVGSISGTPEAGQTLTYTTGQATGGKPQYTYTWEWKKASDGTVVQSNGSTLIVPDTLVGDRVIVALTATDANNNKVTGSTAGYPTSPAIIAKGPFPNTNILFPTALGQQVTTLWADASTTLIANGCIEISTDGGVTWGQGPYAIANGGSLRTRWLTSLACGGAPHGTVIQGCVTSSTYSECGSLTLDRIPSSFAFTAVNNIQPSTTATSNAVTPVGYNATGYVTYTGTSTLTNIQGSLDNGASWTTIPPLGTDTFAINPGQNLIVRGTTGATAGSSYTAIINIGQGQSIQSATFTATNTVQTTFTTVIAFPTTTAQGYTITQPGGTATAIAGAASPSWADGSTTISATGCLEIQVESSGGTVLSAWGVGPFAIANTNILRTRWKTTSVCGAAVHGTTISGTVTNVPNGGTKTTDGALTLDRVVGAYTFQDLTSQATSSVVTSSQVTLSGFNSATYLIATPDSTLTSIQASINGGTWVSVPSSGTSLVIQPVQAQTQTLQIRGTTGGTPGATYSALLRIGEGTSFTADTWSVTTSALVPAVQTPAIVTPVNGSTNINPRSNNPSSVQVAASAYISINGASASQGGSEWEVRVGSSTGTLVYSRAFTGSVTSMVIPEIDPSFGTVLQPNASYFVRVRYYSADLVPVYSAWSSYSQFTTAASFTTSFVLRSSLGTLGGIGYNQLEYSSGGWLGVTDTGQVFGSSTSGLSWGNGATVTGNWEDISHCSANTGVIWMIAGQGTRVSANQGLSWSTPANTGLTTSSILAVAGRPILSTGEATFVIACIGGVMQYTQNAGGSWTSITTGTTANITDVFFDDTFNRYIAIAPGRVLYSGSPSPTGAWTSIAMPSLGTRPSITPNRRNAGYLVHQPFGWAIGGATSSAALLSTGGSLNSWTSVTLPTPTPSFMTSSPSLGYVLTDWEGASLRVWSSETGATGSWIQQQFPVSASYYHGHYVGYGNAKVVVIDHNNNVFTN